MLCCGYLYVPLGKNYLSLIICPLPRGFDYFLLVTKNISLGDPGGRPTGKQMVSALLIENVVDCFRTNVGIYRESEISFEKSNFGLYHPNKNFKESARVCKISCCLHFPDIVRARLHCEFHPGLLFWMRKWRQTLAARNRSWYVTNWKTINCINKRLLHLQELKPSV